MVRIARRLLDIEQGRTERLVEESRKNFKQRSFAPKTQRLPEQIGFGNVRRMRDFDFQSSVKRRRK